MFRILILTLGLHLFTGCKFDSHKREGVSTLTAKKSGTFYHWGNFTFLGPLAEEGRFTPDTWKSFLAAQKASSELSPLADGPGLYVSENTFDSVSYADRFSPFIIEITVANVKMKKVKIKGKKWWVIPDASVDGVSIKQISITDLPDDVLLFFINERSQDSLNQLKENLCKLSSLKH